MAGEQKSINAYLFPCSRILLSLSLNRLHWQVGCPVEVSCAIERICQLQLHLLIHLGLTLEIIELLGSTEPDEMAFKGDRALAKS